MPSKSEFEEILKDRLQTTHLEVEDNSGGCGTMFSVYIVSPLFEGKSLLERQRTVNDLIKEELKDIHALTFKKTITPQQYENLKK
ncbi:BolA-like protein [Acrasis kona]|uniref:BolA-like protein n=1 Tax=Acrasis kona TaxID=1008807 RepID=A0AAW2ZCI6_9EUKA